MMMSVKAASVFKGFIISLLIGGVILLFVSIFDDAGTTATVTDPVRDSAVSPSFSTSAAIEDDDETQSSALSSLCACPTKHLGRRLMPASCATSVTAAAVTAPRDRYQTLDELAQDEFRLCELAALETGLCNEPCESFADCHARVDLSSILPPRCRKNAAVRKIISRGRRQNGPAHREFGTSWRSQIAPQPSVWLSAKANRAIRACQAEELGHSIAAADDVQRGLPLFDDDDESEKRLEQSTKSVSTACLRRRLAPVSIADAVAKFDLPVQRVWDPALNSSVVLHAYAVPDEWVLPLNVNANDDPNHHPPLSFDKKLFGFSPIGADMLRWNREHEEKSDSNKNEKSSNFRFTKFDDGIARAMHERSLFSFINGRYGWSSSRIIEHMALGLVPFVVDHDYCLQYNRTFCMPHMPHDLLTEARNLPCFKTMTQELKGGENNNNNRFLTRSFHVPGNRFLYLIKRNGQIDWPQFNWTQYRSLSRRMHRYVVKYLTASAHALYMLKALQPPRPVRKALVVLCTNQLVESINMVYGLLELDVAVVLAKTEQVKHWWYPKYLSRARRGISTEEFERIKNHVGDSRGAGHVFPLHGNRELLSECELDECRQRIARDEFDIAVLYLVAKEEKDYFAGSIDETGWELMRELRESPMGKSSNNNKNRILIVDGDDLGMVLKRYMGEFATLSQREDRKGRAYFEHSRQEILQDRMERRKLERQRRRQSAPWWKLWE